MTRVFVFVENLGKLVGAWSGNGCFAPAADIHDALRAAILGHGIADGLTKCGLRLRVEDAAFYAEVLVHGDRVYYIREHFLGDGGDPEWLEILRGPDTPAFLAGWDAAIGVTGYPGLENDRAREVQEWAQR